jgi:glycosyltransferase involved in cell wall biosynthesis
MKILHVIRGLSPSYGGPPRVAARLAAGQAALGHDVTIATYRLKDGPEDFRSMTKSLPGFDRVRVVEIDNGGMVEALFALRAGPVLRRLIPEVDIVHLHDVWDSLVRAAGAQARRSGKPYVLQPNDSLNPWSLGQKRLKKRLGLALAYRQVIEGSSAVIFGHSEEKRLAAQSGLRIEPVVAGLGGVFQEEVEPLPAPGRFFERVPQLRGRPFVVFLSRLHPKKGLDFLAEGFAVAARSVPDVQLVVIGHDEGASEDFQRRISRHGLADRVHLVGPMHGHDKWEAYRDAVCLCLPSRDEAFTVTIVEALASGLPVVISETCHFDEVCEYQAGFIVPLEPAKIGKALIRLCTDHALRDRMSQSAKRLFADRLCFNQVARDVLEMYEGCIVGFAGKTVNGTRPLSS